MREVLRKVLPDGQVVNLMKGKDGKVYAVLANAGDPGASVVFPVYWGKGGMPRIGKGRVMNNAELDPSTLESVPVESLLKLQRTGRASLDEQEAAALRARDTQEALPPIGDDTMLEVSEAFPYVNEKGKQAVVPQGSIIRPLKGYEMSEDGNSLVPCMVYRGKEDATGKLHHIPQGVLQAKVQEGILAGRPVSAEDYAQVGADADVDETTDESADAAGKSAPEGTGSVRAADGGEARPEDGERDVESPGNPEGEAEAEAPSGSGEASSGEPGVPEAEAFVAEHGGDLKLSIADAEATARHWEKRAKALRKKAEAGVVYGDARAKAERDRARAGLAEAERQLAAWKKLSEELKREAGREEAAPAGEAAVPGAQEGQEAQAGRPSGGQGGLPGRSLTEGEAEALISEMEAKAEAAPELELTPENWVAEFGGEGVVDTPIGKVKMGENQLAKMFLKKRVKEFGMVKPTLTDPDVIIEKSAPEEGAERDTKYLFVKTFVKPDGSRFVHYESVTVMKDGMEVSISSHEADGKVIKKEMQNGTILHLNEKLSSGSDKSLTGTPEGEGPDLVPTSDKSRPKGKKKTEGEQAAGEEASARAEEEAEQREAELTSRVEIIDDEREEGGGKYPTYKRSIVIDGKHTVTQVDEPDGKGEYRGSYFEYEGKRFGGLPETVSYIDSLHAPGKKAWEPTKGKKGAGKPSLLDAVHTLYTRGKAAASKLFGMKHFDVAPTPEFMKGLGLKGDKFTIRYGVIARHFGKDGSHTLSEKDWERLPQALQNPFAIAKLTDKDDAYRIYTALQTDKGEFVVVGVDVKNAGRDLEVNAVSTVFGRRNNANLPKNEEVIYESKEITPEQQALLKRPNSAQYPAGRELSGGKGSDKSADGQGAGGKAGKAPGQGGTASGEGRGRIAQAVRELAGKLVGTVVAVAAPEAIPDTEAGRKARTAIEAGVPVKGWYDVATGKAYVYLPNAESVEDAVQTVLHEAVAHKGLRGLLGQGKFDELLDKVWASLPFGERKRMLENVTGREFNSEEEVDAADVEERRTAADEWLAYFAENARIENPTLRHRVVSLIRKAIRFLGINLRLSDDDILALLRRSYAKLQQGETETAGGRAGIRLGEGSSTTAEGHEIEARAKANGTWMKAPNGKPTNLTPKQWVQVRTQAFKEWFGDWEKKFMKDYLLHGKPVSGLTGNEFQKDKTPLTEKVGKFYQEKYGGEVTRDGFGKVVLDKRGVKDSLSHGIGRAKSAAFAAVPSIITDGRIISMNENWKGRNHDSYTFAAPVKIGTETYIGVVIVTRGKGKNENRFYLHEVVLQKSLHDRSIKTDTEADSHHGDIANVLKSIVSASDDVSKVVDENGEPLVVYHGSMSDFWTFDKRKIHKNNRNIRGFFFSPTLKVAEFFSGHGDGYIKPVFLNVRNPLVEIRGEGHKPLIEEAIENGTINKYDGTIAKADEEMMSNPYLHIKRDNDIVEIVVPSPSQIKSATDNTGTFSSGNADIRFRIATTAEERAIEEKAKANGTWMKAPNGKPTNLSERQWVQVRTRAFKEWFGDWEKAMKLRMIGSVTPESVDDYQHIDQKEAESIFEKLENGKNIYDGREVQWVKTTIGKILRHRGFDTSRLIPAIKKVFDNSVPIASEPEIKREGHKEHPNLKGYHQYVGKIEADGKEYYVRFTVQEVNTRKKDIVANQLHSTFISDVEITSADTRVNTGNTPATANTSTFVDAKLQQFLEEASAAEANSSKVVDENGEPKVLYHQTGADFTVFDRSIQGAGKYEIELPSGIFLKKSSRDIGINGKRQMPLFARMKNPLRFKDRESAREYWKRNVDGYAESAKNSDEIERSQELAYTRWREQAQKAYADIYETWLRGEIKTAELDARASALKEEANRRIDRLSMLIATTRTETQAILNGWMERSGFDGVIIEKDRGSFGRETDAIIVFSPSQIKSATDNTGTFSSGNADIRFRIGESRKRQMRQQLTSKLTNASAEQIESTIAEIEKLGEQSRQGGDSKVEKAATHWAVKGTVILPEDNGKILQAMGIVNAKKLDFMKYDSPMEIVNEFSGFSPKEKPVDPDSVPTLRNKRTLRNGITIYEVEESERSRENMRGIINTHFGKDCSPWCLLQGDGDGKLTGESARYWAHYNAYPKRVVFKDGRLVAFSANDKSEVVYWDRQDMPHAEIPFTGKIPGDELGRSGTVLYNPETGAKERVTGLHKGNKRNGQYEEWDDNGKLLERSSWKDGKLDGLYEEWDDNGRPRIRSNYKDGNRNGLHETWFDNGQLRERSSWKDNNRNGLSEAWYSNGQLSKRTNYKDGKLDGLHEEWYFNGQLSERTNYKDDNRNGLSEAWYSNGQLSERTNYKDGKLDGMYEA